MSIFWLVIGAICLVYYFICVAYAGFGTAFAFVWAIVGSGSLLLSFICRQAAKGIITIPMWLKVAFWSVIGLGLALFIVLEICVLTGVNSKPQEDCDYVIVLGAQVRGTRITKSLARRLDAAYEYHLKNPDAIIIVSGGKGNGEDVSEAQAMTEYLIAKGVPAQSIIMEDKSTNTNENLEFSMEFIEDKSSSVAIVTNDFHIFRAIHIAKKKGLDNVCGVPAPSDEILFINYYVREAIGILKDFLVGNL